MRHRRFAVVLLVPLIALLASCGTPQSAPTTEPKKQQSSQTPKSNSKTDSNQQKTVVDDPTQGDWTDAYSGPSDLDGELDEAWLDCAPHNAPDPEAFSWKRSTDHSKVWMHATEGGMDGSSQRSCIADELDIADTADLSDSWTVTSLGDYDRYQKRSGNVINIVWQYSDAVKKSLTVESDSYRVTLPYSWHNKITTSVDGSTITVTDREHPKYALCTFQVSDSSNAGDIGTSLIQKYQAGNTPVQMWATRWAFVAASDPASISADDAEDVTDLQTGGTIEYDSISAQIRAGDTSGVFAIDDYLKAHIAVSGL